jgi:PEGA domain
MIMRSPRPRPFALCAALALTLPSLAARAEGPAPAPAPASAPAPISAQEEAASRFKKGLDLFKESDYQAALIELRRANELAPNYNVLYNIGQVYFQLQDYPNALHSLESYLQEGGKAIDPKRRVEVERDIEKLKSRVANIEIEVNVPDAEVTIDEISAGKTPLPKSVLVGAGRHRIVVSKPGFTPITRVVEIASAELKKVPIDLLETKPLALPPPPAPLAPHPAPAITLPPPQRHPPSRTLPTIGWAVTGGLTAGAVVTGILALGASSSLKTERTSGTATRDDLEGAKSKTQTLALATDILAGCAIVTGGLSLYFTLAPGSSSEARSPALTRSGPTLNVAVTPSGASLLGTF